MSVIKAIAWGCILIGLIGFVLDSCTGVVVGLYHIIPFFLVGIAMEFVHKELKRINEKLR